MIQIDDKYFIDADSRNYVLQEKTVQKTGKNAGQEVFKDLGYFNNLEKVFKYIVNSEIRQYISRDRLNTLEQLTKKINTIEAKLDRQFDISRKP